MASYDSAELEFTLSPPIPVATVAGHFHPPSVATVASVAVATPEILKT